MAGKKSKGARSRAKTKKPGSAEPGLLSAVQRRSPPLASVGAALPGSVGVVHGTAAFSAGQEGGADVDDVSSIASAPMHRGAGAQQSDVHALGIPRSISTGVLDEARSQVERMLLASLDEDAKAHGTSPHARKHKRVVSVDAAPGTFEPDVLDALLDDEWEASGTTSREDPTAEGSARPRHVYFDERMLHRQSSRQFWHHEARTARRQVLQPAHQPTGIARERLAMDMLVQRIQAQIQVAGNRLLASPAETRTPSPPRESLPYAARGNLGTRVPLPKRGWDELTSSLVRPILFYVQLDVEFHLPIISRPSHTSESMHARLVAVAEDIVQHALRVKARARKTHEPAKRANPYLMLLPLPALAWIASVLNAGSVAREKQIAHFAWLAPFASAHWNNSFYLQLLRVSLPSAILWHFDWFLFAFLEIALVLVQFVLCIVIALARSLAFGPESHREKSVSKVARGRRR
ncbi:hypothetical protein MSPP1_000294 [Malassezia sp. CBS 17886]|nr:hypothetical protein MSPP1_000294 [Malassezia sp. CBS 17886]